ncbi:MAG: hypothetical protein N2C12_04270 [Planctomycetales bacterium]
MKGCHGWLTLALCLLAAGGCRSQSASTVALERELRYQEDMIYQLQDYVETYKLYLDECRRENVACRDGKSIATGRPGLPKIELNSPEQDSGNDQGSPSPGSSPGSGEFQPPDVQLESRLQIPSGESAVRALYRDSVLKRNPTIARTSYVPTDMVVTSMKLDPEQTGGFQGDDLLGSEGILVGLVPHNADGQIVPPVGEIAVAVLDLAATEPDRARVARWKFSAAQVALISSETPAGEGTLLELPWPREVPQSRNLQVFVRLVTPEETRLVSEQQIDLSSNRLFVKSTPAEESIDQGQVATEDGWQTRTRKRPLLPVTSNTVSAAPTVKKRRRPKWQPFR